jgi:hypothetical protein
LPETYQKLTGYANCLPGDEFVAGYPFCGLVLNLNISTKIHRDPEDLDICLIIVISECTGGELVMYEPGLVVGQRNGDMIAFPSGDISHFNMDFSGFRSSIVFHSDAASESWTGPHTNGEDQIPEMSTRRTTGKHDRVRNGWSENSYLHSTH